ncbi:hypothetical protein FRAHR75_440025 [Frankia sp. Hr75.2]|nr:hypothetical protein FRAHR75_440025 [Frankia sp. Hr75.2]
MDVFDTRNPQDLLPDRFRLKEKITLGIFPAKRNLSSELPVRPGPAGRRLVQRTFVQRRPKTFFEQVEEIQKLPVVRLDAHGDPRNTTALGGPAVTHVPTP